MIHNLVESDYHLERIRELLSEGIGPNLQDVFGNTPLQTAGLSIMINIKIIRELISAGADVNLVNRTEYTSLHYAALRRKHEMVDALLLELTSILRLLEIQLFIMPSTIAGTNFFVRRVSVDRKFPVFLI
ncbi:hypothetical protein AVEN_247222-1 [Araneus ventricosus]|uniref:Uncharacterized protein n=1 Tax=Araneus ventricosus TaxID=182803 RepID=A0A4Y2ET80_ARAVE|nr:hypothetical protein AVEN_247222-1 [Araneus ventricosus]